jgi:apolipoprotein N-acyltransferase
MPVTITDERLQTSDNVNGRDRRRTSYRPWLWFAVGTVLLFFSYGANNVALAAWLSPMFLLHFVRRETWRVWIPLLLLAQAAASAFQLRGMFPVGGSAYYVSLAMGSLETLVPFIPDAWLARRIGGFASTLQPVS